MTENKNKHTKKVLVREYIKEIDGTPEELYQKTVLLERFNAELLEALKELVEKLEESDVLKENKYQWGRIHKAKKAIQHAEGAR